MTSFNIHKLTYKNNYKRIEDLLKKDKNLIYTRGINYDLPIHIACSIGSENLVIIAFGSLNTF